MLKKGLFLIFGLLCLSFNPNVKAYAEMDDSDGSVVNLNPENIHPLTKECIIGAAKLQSIDPRVMVGLLKTEGGYIGADVRNTNGSHDLGPMQINDGAWLEKIATAHFSGNQKLARLALKNNGCYNVYIGAYIFRTYLDEAHGKYTDAVGFYHSHTYDKKISYERLVAKNLLSIFGKKG